MEAERRPDVDIEDEIDLLCRSFAPLKASRGYFTIKSVKGRVRLIGNVRSPQARRGLLDNVPHIPAGGACDRSGFYDDRMIRVGLGQMLAPWDVFRVTY